MLFRRTSGQKDLFTRITVRLFQSYVILPIVNMTLLDGVLRLLAQRYREVPEENNSSKCKNHRFTIKPVGIIIQLFVLTKSFGNIRSGSVGYNLF